MTNAKKQLSARDRRIVVALPAVALAAGYVWLQALPALDAHTALERRLEAAGRTPEAWRQPITAAERDRAEAEKAVERERTRFAEGLKTLRRETPNLASAVRSKPGALAALNGSVSKSGAKIVSATTCEGRDASGGPRAVGDAGTWDVTFLATYAEMRETLKALSDEPGVLVRRIDRLASEDAGAKPIWKLMVEM